MSKELVKDRVIKYLVEDLLVPQDMIDTDVDLSEFEDGEEGTIDIIVNTVDEKQYFVPLMIIQCLDEDISLEGKVLDKQISFLEKVDNITTSGRLVLTNGDEMMYADWKNGEYDTEAALPTYDIMLNEFIETEKLEDEHDNCDCHVHNRLN